MKQLFTFLILALPSLAFSQIGVNFHQSNLPFVGINYEINDRFRPELRIGIDNYVENLSVEPVVTYDFVETEDYEIYGGAGVRIDEEASLAVPVGMNIFPFNAKQFGFHMEVAPLIGEDVILRASWGIRYQFNRKKDL